MKIKQVSGKNVKGWTGTIPLTAVTIVAGRTGSGKTAIADALEIALTGQHHEAGKKAGAIFGKSSGASMECAAVTETGAVVSRKYQATKTGASCKATAPDGWPESPAVLFNAGAFFNGTAREQTSMLFGACSSQSQQEIVDAVLAEIAMKSKEFPAIPQASLDLDLDGLDRYDTGLPGWFDAAIEKAKMREAEAKQAEKRYTQTAMGLSRISENRDGGRHVSQVEADIAARRAEAKKLERELAEKESELALKYKALDDGDKLKEEIADIENGMDPGAPEDPRPVEDIKAKIASERALQTKAAVAEARNAAVKRALETAEPRKADIARELASLRPVAATKDQAELALSAAESELKKQKEPSVLDGLAGALVEKTSKLVATLEERLRTQELQRKAAAERFVEDSECACCPTCGEKSAGWKKSLTEKFQAEDTANKNAVQLTAEQKTNAETAHKKATESVERCERYAEAQAAVESAKAKAVAADYAANRIVDLTTELSGIEHGQEFIQLDRNSWHHAQEIEALEAELQHVESLRKIEALESRIKALGLPSPEDFKALVAKKAETLERVASSEAAIAELEAEAKEARNRAATEQSIVEATKQADAAKLEADAFASIAKLVEAKRETVLAETLGPVLDSINLFCDGCCSGKVEFRGELGCFDSAGSWITVPNMSGGERAAVTAGIQGALSRSGPFRILVTDELVRMIGTKQRFITNVFRAIKAGVIEQFFGCDGDPAAWGHLAGNDGFLLHVTK